MEVKSKVCPSCKAQNNPNFSKCWKCGIDLATGLPSQLSQNQCETSKTIRIDILIFGSIVIAISVFCLLWWILMMVMPIFPGTDIHAISKGATNSLRGYYLKNLWSNLSYFMLCLLSFSAGIAVVRLKEWGRKLFVLTSLIWLIWGIFDLVNHLKRSFFISAMDFLFPFIPVLWHMLVIGYFNLKRIKDTFR